MGKLGCRCGYSHDLSPIPDAGYVVISYSDFLNRLEDVVIRRREFASADYDTPEWNALLQADGELAAMTTRFYQCPQCDRIR
jgi:hypothetical protein